MFQTISSAAGQAVPALLPITVELTTSISDKDAVGTVIEESTASVLAGAQDCTPTRVLPAVIARHPEAVEDVLRKAS